MTKEEAKIYFDQCNRKIISVCKDENKYDYEKEEIISECERKTYEANRLALEALEQDSALDKIRAEIEQLPTAECTETQMIFIIADDFKEDVLEVIDKYKAENSQMTNEKATETLSTEPCERIEYGTDGNAYKMSISNGKEFETCVNRGV